VPARVAGYDCPGRPHPKGTNLVAIEMTKNTTSQINVKAIFDGPLPRFHENLQAGDLRVSLLWYFFTGPTDHHPYQVMLSDVLRTMAGRLGYGPIDSSSFVQKESGNVWYLSFDPDVFTQLPAGRLIAFAGDVIVERFIADGSELGYSQVGRYQDCPAPRN
jgi:hypothetical protein